MFMIKQCTGNISLQRHGCLSVLRGNGFFYKDMGAKLVVDSAFKIENKEYVIKSAQQDTIYGHELLLNRAATSIWKLSELGCVDD